MKRIILIAICVFATLANMAVTTQLATQTLTNSEIAAIVAMSKEANLANGVLNPDLIQPGQQLTFLFQDGATGTITVGAGDTQWSIVRTKLAEMQITHGDVVEYVEPVVPKTPEVVTPKKDEQQAVVAPPVVQESSIDWLAWIAVAIIAIVATTGLVYMIVSGEGKKLLNQLRYGKDVYNPVTGGRPVIEGGIRNGNHASEVLRDNFVRNYNQQNPGNQITAAQTAFTRGQKGKAYSDGHVTNVDYWNHTQAERILTGQEAWEGIVRNLTNNTETRVIALAACGNAVVRNLEYVRFVPDSIQEPVQSSNPPVTTETQITLTTAQVNANVKFVEEITKIAQSMTNGGEINFTSGDSKLEIKINAPAIGKTQAELAVAAVETGNSNGKAAKAETGATATA